jgi:hypothetical protein
MLWKSCDPDLEGDRLLRKDMAGKLIPDVEEHFKIRSLMEPTVKPEAPPFLSFRDLWERDRRTGKEARRRSP